MILEATKADKDLHELQYAAWVCENSCAMPANKSNTTVVSEAIRSIARSKFRDEKWKHPLYTAFLWLVRQIEFAQIEKRPVNHLFFLNAEYLEVKEPEKKLPEFVSCGKCSEGWVNVAPEGQDKKLKRCECWGLWKERIA